jgi:hypothetical protein
MDFARRERLFDIVCCLLFVVGGCGQEEQDQLLYELWLRRLRPIVVDRQLGRHVPGSV